MRPISCVEGEPFSIEPSLRDAVRSAALRLRSQLRPRFRPLSEERDQFTIQGVIGTIDIGSGTVLEVAPKTEPQDDWIHAVLDLLIGTDRIDAAGERAAGLSSQRRDLFEVLAAIYAARLQRALRRDGPILLIERHRAELPILKGKLSVTPWLRHAAWQPHRLPVSYDQLTPDHDFSRGLAAVARRLATVTRSPETKGTLLNAARALRPGFGEEAVVAPNVAGRQLPAQWSVYKSAWSIAAAMLARRSLLGAAGTHQGISIAIEAWPLLERLLQRSLSAAARIGDQNNRQISNPGCYTTLLLDEPHGSATQVHSVKPDGQLVVGDNTIATFEAKYRQRQGMQEWPPRAHVFQTLATAAACGSPLAVLVYPELFPTAWWRVRGFQGSPGHIAAIGLGLFSYRAGIGDEERGRRILDLLDGPPQGDMTPSLLLGSMTL